MQEAKNNGGAVLKILIAVVMLTAVMWLCSARGGFTPRACVELPEPAETVRGFFSALSDGRYDDCDAMLYNYSSLGLTSSSDTAMGQQLYDMLRESYSFRLITLSSSDALAVPSESDVSATDAYLTRKAELDGAAAKNTVFGKDAVQAVSFTHLDVSSLSDDLHDRATEVAYQYAYNSIDINNEETAEAAISEALEQLSGSASDYYRTDIFIISLKYVDGEWKIVLDDALYHAIIGNAA